jgi:hypothetical protein
MERHDAVRGALRSREPIFHRPEHGTTRADFEAMTADDFWEVGASGGVYDRAFVLGSDSIRGRGSVAPAPDLGFRPGATHGRCRTDSAPTRRPAQSRAEPDAPGRS